MGYITKMVEAFITLLYNSEALRRQEMSTNTKKRGAIWLFLSLAVVFAVGATSYTVQSSNLDGELIFENKTEDQIGLEFLEIYSYQYEERPIISIQRDEYSFDIHRANRTSNGLETHLYVVFKDLTVTFVNDFKVPSVGILDAFVYCSTDEDPYDSLVSTQRMGWIPGTDVYANFIELEPRFIDNCETNNFTFVIDTPQLLQAGQTSDGTIEVLEAISLSEVYDLQEVSTGALLAQTVNLNDGFSGDITKSSYNIFSLQQAALNATLSIPIVLPIAFGLWYSTEKELFGQSVSLKGLRKNLKKSK